MTAAFCPKSRLIICIFALAIISQAARARDTTGIPWQGERGITETVDEIMARQAVLTPGGQGQDVTPVQTHNPHNELASPKHNPRAPKVSQWPPPDVTSPVIPPTASPQTVGAGWLGVELADAPYIPPDSMGAAGPNQVMVIVNGRIRVFNKAGALGPLDSTTDNFFNSVRSASTSDPKVCYDRLTQRWFVSMIDVAADNRVMLAVSSGPTITGITGWTFFQFRHDLVGSTPNSDTGGFADYDTLGVDRYAIYIGVNVFNGSGTAVLGTTAFVINKSNLFSGTLTVTAFRQVGTPTSGPWTPQGVSNDDPNSTEGYFVSTDRGLLGQIDINRISNPGGTPSISSVMAVTVPATSKPISQTHKGKTGNKNLDALDDRLFSAAIFKNKITGTSSLWTAHNIQVDATGVGSNTGGRNGSRWYEIGNLTDPPALIQAGTLFDSAASSPRGYWIPSVAMSGQGHMGLGSSYAGANFFAGVAASGRFRTDPLGNTQLPTQAMISSTAYNLMENSNPHRWGDFSHTVVDPNDDMTMWTFQEYCNAANSWGVRVVQLKAPPPATPTNAVPPSIAQGQSNVTVAVSGISVAGSEYFDPGQDIGGPGYSNHITAAISGAGVTINGVTFSNVTNIVLNLSVSANALAGARTLTVTNPDGQSAASTPGIITILGPPGIISPPTNTNIAVGASATFTVSATGTPVYYQWRFNSLELGGATNSLYSVTNAQCSDAGSFDVVVTNSYGAITSSPALLTVVSPPAIASQPAAQTIAAGQSAFFAVSATNECGLGFSYQWQFNGTNLNGATASGCSVTNAQLANAGGYAVIVSNLAGSATSSVAVLTVVSPPLVDFSANPTAGPAPLTVFFTNLTSGATNYGWSFGDGNGSTDLAPAYTYTNPGNYSVQLSAAGSGGTSLLTRAGYISVSIPPPLISVYPPDQSNFVFSFPTFTSRTYVVQFKNSLDDSNWQTLQSAPGDGATRFVTNALADAPQRFYRLLLP
jgi:PKD repeat protein